MIVKQPTEISKDPHWEQGSEFHLNENIQHDRSAEYPWNDNGLLFGTGRDAMKAIIIFGMASCGWKRLWIPAYFCQEVVSSIAETGIVLQNYSSWYPGKHGITEIQRFETGDVVLVVNHFGLHSESDVSLDLSNASAIIEDHSHDPWSTWAFTSKADYCVASLRKTLPVPDGGVLWSPKRHELPTLPIITKQHRIAAEKKLESMRLKTQFLNGQIADKSRYRALSLEGEENLCGADISAILEWTSQNLNKFPVEEWRESRKRNYQVLFEALSPLLYLRVIGSTIGTEIVPFSCLLLFDSAERREFVRLSLIRANIFPAILWSLEKPAIKNISKEYVDASKRMLSIHCDMRYSKNDMSIVAVRIKEFGYEFQG